MTINACILLVFLTYMIVLLFGHSRFFSQILQLIIYYPTFQYHVVLEAQKFFK